MLVILVYYSINCYIRAHALLLSREKQNSVILRPDKSKVIIFVIAQNSRNFPQLRISFLSPTGK